MKSYAVRFAVCKLMGGPTTEETFKARDRTEQGAIDKAKHVGTRSGWCVLWLVQSEVQA